MAQKLLVVAPGYLVIRFSLCPQIVERVLRQALDECEKVLLGHDGMQASVIALRAVIRLQKQFRAQRRQSQPELKAVGLIVHARPSTPFDAAADHDDGNAGVELGEIYDCHDSSDEDLRAGGIAQNPMHDPSAKGPAAPEDSSTTRDGQNNETEPAGRTNESDEARCRHQPGENAAESEDAVQQWSQLLDPESGEYYFLNSSTGVTAWEVPLPDDGPDGGRGSI